MKLNNMTDVLIWIQRNRHAVRTLADKDNPEAQALSGMIEAYLNGDSHPKLSVWHAAVNAYIVSREKASS